MSLKKKTFFLKELKNSYNLNNLVYIHVHVSDKCLLHIMKETSKNLKTKKCVFIVLYHRYVLSMFHNRQRKN